MKAFKTSKRVLSSLIAIMLLVMSCQSFLAADGDEKKPLNIPEITLENLQVRGGSTTYLVDNPPYSETAPTMRDFDFGPGSDNMQDAYIVYNYGNEVMIESLTLVGWWPKDQAVKNISLEYFKDGQWVTAQENIEVPWQTSGGTEEEVEITLTEPVTTMKFRVKINSAYHSWSDKICMHLMRPNGYIVTEFKPLTDAIAQAEKLVSQVLIGNKGGEFSQDAVDSLNAVTNEIKEKLDAGLVTADDIPVMIEQIETAIEEFTSSQNPMENAPAAEAENLTVSLGNTNYLTDRQISTGMTVSFTDSENPAYLTLDFSGKNLNATGLTLLASSSDKFTLNMSAEAEIDGVWTEIAAATDFNYRCDVQGTEGHKITFDSCTASKFRIKINSSTAESFTVYEILWDGLYDTDTSAMDNLINKANAIINNPASSDYPDLLDILKIVLSPAENQETSILANQGKIDTITQLLSEAISAFDGLAQYEKGDVNHSGSLEIEDVTLIQKHIVKLLQETDFFDEYLADVDNDGVISIKDATSIQIAISSK